MNKQTPSLTSSKYALLGLLAAGPCHGYELHRKFADPDGIGLIWGVKISNMYAQLAKLAQRGLISGKLQENEQRPARTQYSLTPGGKQQFISWLHTPVQHPRDFRHDFFLQLYFVSQYEPGKLDTLVENQIETCRSWQQNLAESQESSASLVDFATLTNRFRYSQVQSMVDWLTWLKNNKTKISSPRGEQ
ncbi:MAG TPA: PadR family transcriptional regulator [Anaerolineaceae bacterium]|nr:PadR family transcriptional regulator [Anaerolineaceae bacterium]